jgi:hypothetical protein
MLCRFCEDLDLDEVGTAHGVDHHASFADLVTSARSGCKLCVFIRNEREEEDDHGLALVDTQNDTKIRCLYNTTGPLLIWDRAGDRKRYRLLPCGYVQHNLSQFWKSSLLKDVLADFKLQSDDSISELLYTRPICPDASSWDCFDLMNNWLYECSELIKSVLVEARPNCLCESST